MPFPFQLIYNWKVKFSHPKLKQRIVVTRSPAIEKSHIGIKTALIHTNDKLDETYKDDGVMSPALYIRLRSVSDEKSGTHLEKFITEPVFNFPMFNKKSWKLGIAKKRQEEAPYTFYVPPKNILDKLKKDNIAKLLFEFSGGKVASTEKMWVLITERKGDKFNGILDNDPVEIKDLKHGDKIKFESKHVIATDIDEPNNMVEKYIKQCFVTNKVFEKKRVGYLYHENPDNKEDSGWRIFEGSETDEYANNAKNVQVRSLGSVLNVDDSFIEVLDAPIGSSFERYGKKFRKIEE